MNPTAAPAARRRRVVHALVLGFVACAISAGRAAEPVGGPDDAPLRARIRDMRAGVRDVPLPLIIEALTEHRVLSWNGEYRLELDAAAASILSRLTTDGVTAARVNEAGNAVEPVVIAALQSAGFDVRRPAGLSGRAHAAGYPDLEARRGDAAAFYVEVKTFSATTADSTQRSFYLSPSTDFKVTRDAVHLLVAVELAPGEDRVYRARSVKWLDLSRLRCDLKYEFNANNRDLYRPEAGLVIIER